VKQESFVEVLNRKELGFGMINHDESMINIYSMQHPLPLQMYHLTPPVLTNKQKKKAMGLDLGGLKVSDLILG